MAYDNKQEQDKRPKAPFDLFKLTLWAPSPTAPGKNASFNVDVGIDGIVTLRVRTGDPADKEKAKDGDQIVMRMQPKQFNEWVILFDEVLRGKGENRKQIVEQVWYRWDKDAGKRVKMDAPRDGTKLSFGKDADGKVFVALTAYKRTDIEFGYFDPSRAEFWYVHGDGNRFTEGEMSQSAARGYLAEMRDLQNRISNSRIIQHLTPDLFQPPYVPKPPQGGYGGGNGNNNNRGGGGGYGGGGGQSKPAAAPASGFEDDDTDIPY